MVLSAGSAFLFMSRAQHRAQASPNPCVFGLKDVFDAMLEVFKPAPQGLVHIGDDFFHRLCSQPPRFLPYRLPKFISALLARPSIAPFEVISQEVETAFLTSIHYARLGRMQRQSHCLRPLAH